MDWQNILYFLFWAALFIVMMRFGCGAHIMGHRHRGAGPSGTGQGAGWTLPTRATDPVCRMTVAIAGAKSAVHAGRVYFFCSQDCRDKFERNPTAYEKASDVPSREVEAHDGCC